MYCGFKNTIMGESVCIFSLFHDNVTKYHHKHTQNISNRKTHKHNSQHKMQNNNEHLLYKCNFDKQIS